MGNNRRIAILMSAIFISTGLMATDHDPQKYKHIKDLPEGYITDGFCVPYHGIHYVDITRPLYKTPIYVANSKGRIVAVNFKFRKSELVDGSAFSHHGFMSDTNTKGQAKSVSLVYYSEAELRELLPPLTQELACANYLPPTYNLCQDHYDFHVSLISESDREKLCQ